MAKTIMRISRPKTLAVQKRLNPDVWLDRMNHYVQGWLATKATSSQHTADAYEDALYRSGPDVLNARPNEITRSVAGTLYTEWTKKWGVATANLTASAWSSLWEDMLADDIPLPPNPWKHIRRKKPANTLNQRMFTVEEIQILLAHAQTPRNRTLLRFLYVTGCRVSEAIALTWADCTPNPDGSVTATVYGKGGKTRAVRIRPAVWEAMRQLPRKTLHDRIFPTTRQSVWRMMQRAAKGTPLEGRIVSPHGLRHSHASHALEAGANLVAIQQQLGHSRLDTTQIYAHLRPGPRSEAFLEDF